MSTVARLGAQLADALTYVHTQGVTHRDIKPANVLFDEHYHPLLTDFGIALLVDATRITLTGAMIGTAAYMALEQVRGELVGPPTDVYSVVSGVALTAGLLSLTALDPTTHGTTRTASPPSPAAGAAPQARPTDLTASAVPPTAPAVSPVPTRPAGQPPAPATASPAVATKRVPPPSLGAPTAVIPPTAAQPPSAGSHTPHADNPGGHGSNTLDRPGGSSGEVGERSPSSGHR